MNNIQKREILESLYRERTGEVLDFASILLDCDGTILSWNAEVREIKGYTSEEIVGQNFGIFYLPADRQSGLPQRLLAEAMAHGSAAHVGRRVRKDGTVYTGNIVITALSDDDGQVIGFSKRSKKVENSN